MVRSLVYPQLGGLEKTGGLVIFIDTDRVEIQDTRYRCKIGVRGIPSSRMIFFSYADCKFGVEG